MMKDKPNQNGMEFEMNERSNSKINTNDNKKK